MQPGVVSPVFQWCAKILDEAVAWCVHFQDCFLYPLPKRFMLRYHTIILVRQRANSTLVLRALALCALPRQCAAQSKYHGSTAAPSSSVALIPLFDFSHLLALNLTYTGTLTRMSRAATGSSCRTTARGTRFVSLVSARSYCLERCSIFALQIQTDCGPFVGFSRGAYTARALAGFLHKVSPIAPTIVPCLLFWWGDVLRVLGLLAAD